MNSGSGSRWFVVGACGAILCGGLAAGVVVSPMPRTFAQDALSRMLTTVQPAKGAGARHVPVRLPSTLPGPLDGQPTPRGDALRRAIAVTIDNYFPDARPQTGLSAASVIFETLAEGGITRLMAVYLERDPAVVGPVRSTRVYFDDWAAAFHAVLAHVGGNDDADAQLWQLPTVYNLDQGTLAFVLSATNHYFWQSPQRSIPDNMYANLAKLESYAARRGQDWRYKAASLPHKKPAAASGRGAAGILSLSFVDPLYPFSQAIPDYAVQYRFDPRTDSYLRFAGGIAQIDAGTHQPLRAANIVVMQTGAGIADLAAGTTVGAIDIPVIGSGPAMYFRDGHVAHGTWQQKDPQAPLRFIDRRGKPVTFNPGQTWIEVLPQYSSASWTFHAAGKSSG